jgi:hypothetical protein
MPVAAKAMVDKVFCATCRKIIACFASLIIVLIAPACSVLQGTSRDSVSIAEGNEYATRASLELARLSNIDAVAKLNNEWISARVKGALLDASSASEQYNLKNIKITFNNYFIYIEGILDVSDKYENRISASFSGEVKLNLNPAYLNWYANIDQLSISSTDFSFDGGQYAEAIPELEQDVLKKLHDEFLLDMTRRGVDSIPMSAMPLGEIQVGAGLPGISDTPARRTEALRGVFLKSRDATMVEPKFTSIALELIFLPNISHCATDIHVSRSAFAQRIVSREPNGITGKNARSAEIRYFFSEISGARRPYKLVHYWYANGKAVAFEELDVGASSRWRTWSSTGMKFSPGDELEILVVDKESGCILLSKAIEIAGDKRLPAAEDLPEDMVSQEDYRTAFQQETADFNISGAEPGLAVVRLRRASLTGALQNSLSDVTASASFNIADIVPLNWKAQVRAFDPDTIACQRRECPPESVCEVNISHCKRFRDTRECSSCLFRNPLNNRCISEAIDPVCELSRDRQNKRYDQERLACIESAEKTKQECDFQNAQASRSCRIEASFADNACDAIKSSIENLKPGAPLAYVQASTKPRGTLNANFSNIQIEGDLERMKLDISLTSNMHLAGNMSFSPGNVATPLADCITSWSAPFKSRFANTPTVENLQSQLETGNSLVSANWSGFGLNIELKPTPLGSVLVENPQALANCKIGLTVSRVEQSISGDDEAFYRGQLKLDIQPLQTRIHLAPATMVLGESALSAEAQLHDQWVSYEFLNQE